MDCLSCACRTSCLKMSSLFTSSKPRIFRRYLKEGQKSSFKGCKRKTNRSTTPPGLLYAPGHAACSPHHPGPLRRLSLLEHQLGQAKQALPTALETQTKGLGPHLQLTPCRSSPSFTPLSLQDQAQLSTMPWEVKGEEECGTLTTSVFVILARRSVRLSPSSS